MGNDNQQDRTFGRRLIHFLFRFICKLIPALIGAALTLAVVLLSFVPTSNGAVSEQIVRPAFLAKDINIDGSHYDNYFLDKPVLTAHGEYYLPATEQMLGILGVETAWNSDGFQKLVYVDPWNTPFWKTAKTWLFKSRSESADGKELLEFRLTEGSSVVLEKKLVTNLRAYETLTNTTDLFISKVDSFGAEDLRNGWLRLKEQLDPESSVQIVSENGEELFFDADGRMYFSTQFLRLLGFDVWVDDLTGLYISTREGVSAESLYNPHHAKIVDVLSDYMMSANKKLDKETAIYYEYLFRHESNVTGINELTIIAVAKTESNFRSDAKGNGSLGMMQPLTRYAPRYGYDREMLLNPHYNIELCSMYLMDRMHIFWDEELMLVAYNRGSASVFAGRRSSEYSRKVLKIKSELQEKLDAE